MKRQKLTLPDTNIVLRYLLHDHDEHYVRANAFFENVREGHLHALLLEGVLVECIHVLTKFYKVPRKETAEKLHALLQYKGIMNSDRQELLDALQSYGETGLDIVDCILVAKGNREGRDVFSFDRGILSRAKKTGRQT